MSLVGEPEGPSTPAGAVDVLLVDGRAVVREGLCVVIDQEPDLVVVAQAATVRDAGSLDVEPHVIVTDIDLTDAKRDGSGRDGGGRDDSGPFDAVVNAL